MDAYVIWRNSLFTKVTLDKNADIIYYPNSKPLRDVIGTHVTEDETMFTLSKYIFIIFTQPLSSGKIWHMVNF